MVDGYYDQSASSAAAIDAAALVVGASGVLCGTSPCDAQSAPSIAASRLADGATAVLPAPSIHIAGPPSLITWKDTGK